MLYINQLELPDVLYLTDKQTPDSERAKSGTIATSGCGICSACMMIDRLCMESLSLDACIQMSYDVKANMEPGTDMKLLGAELAKRFKLQYKETDSLEVLNDWLRRGACAIVNVGGDREGHKGLFASVGHYMVITRIAEGEYQILDPAWSKEQYEGMMVRQDGKIIYATPEMILGDTANRSPAFYIFRKE